MLNALTIDVEDYYHVSAFEAVVPVADWDRYDSRVEQHTHRHLDLLDAHTTKATFFVLDWVAERHPGLLRTLAAHGYAHQRVYTQTPAQFRAETRRSKRLLEDTLGHPIRGYRAASYSITRHSLWALNVLREEGFGYDSSIFPIRHDLYGIPRHPRFCSLLPGPSEAPLVEFPLSTLRLGGPMSQSQAGGICGSFPMPIPGGASGI